EIGMRFIEALIARAMGNESSYDKAVARFLHLSHRLEKYCELALGKGGVLVACSLLLDDVDDSKRREILKTRGEQIYRRMMSDFREGRISSPSSAEYLGIAHGVAGVLYALLSWHEIVGRDLPQELRVALTNLAESGRRMDRGVRWPMIRGKRTYWSGWC